MGFAGAISGFNGHILHPQLKLFKFQNTASRMFTKTIPV